MTDSPELVVAMSNPRSHSTQGLYVTVHSAKAFPQALRPIMQFRLTSRLSQMRVMLGEDGGHCNGS
jgi:hypothetical protein